MNKTKAKQTAKDWLFSALMYAILDCCDSMHDAEALENRFNAFVEDSITIEDYVRKNLYDEYLDEVINVLKEDGTVDEWKELESTPSCLPIPFDEIKKDLERKINALPD